MIGRLLPCDRAALALAGVSLLVGCAPPASPPALPAAASSPAAPAAGRAAAEAVQGATVEGITEYTLPNGLRVLLLPDRSKPTTTVNITYLVGSRHEGYGEAGMAHLLEHLLFKGTPGHPNIPQELTERGARPNGTTWYDRTNYFETFPATGDNLEWALDLEADRMVNSFVAAEDLASEMTVVRNEFESGENTPSRVLLNRVMSTAYLWHNYGNATIGSRSDIENVPIERLRAFYRKYYQPDNAVLMIAGKLDRDAALELVEEKFGGIARPDRTGDMQLFPTYTAEPTQDGERAITLRRAGNTQVVMAMYHVPPGSHPAYAAVDVLTHLLSAEPSGPLYQALVQTGKAADIGAFSLQLREPGALFASARVRETGSIQEARDALVEALETVAENPPSAEDVERSKAALLNEIRLTMNDSEALALEASEWVAAGDWRLMFLHRDRLRAVTPADVQAAAARYLKPSNRTLGSFIPTERPDRAEIPAAPDLAPLVAQYRGGGQREEGEAFEPTAENISARTLFRTLPNGLQMALLPKETRGNTVSALLTLRLGSESALMGRATAGRLAAAMLMRGTEDRTRQEIRYAIDRLNAQAQVYGGTEVVFGRIETVRENFPEVLRLVAEILRRPRFDAEEWEGLKQQQISANESLASDPGALATGTLHRYLNPRPEGHPSYGAPPEERAALVEAARLADARRFHRDFYGAQAAQMAVVGDFDPDEVTRVAEELFGTWTAREPYERVPTPFQRLEPTTIEILTPDKANAALSAGMLLNMSDRHEDYPALLLANYILGGGFQNSRLATRIRQQEGISYRVSSALHALPRDDRAFFSVRAIYAPENVDRLMTAFREELERALRDGFTPEELAAAKQGYLQSLGVSRGDDRELASLLVDAMFLGRSVGWSAELAQKIEALTPDQVLAALRRHIDPAAMTIVRAGDFRATSTGAPASR